MVWKKRRNRYGFGFPKADESWHNQPRFFQEEGDKTAAISDEWTLALKRQMHIVDEGARSEVVSKDELSMWTLDDLAIVFYQPLSFS